MLPALVAYVKAVNQKKVKNPATASYDNVKAFIMPSLGVAKAKL